LVFDRIMEQGRADHVFSRACRRDERGDFDQVID
jgi:hypothetical protein